MCRWHWRKTFCHFYLFSLKEEIASYFSVSTLTVHSFIQWANQCLFSVYLMLVCVGHTSDTWHQHVNHPPWEIFHGPSHPNIAPTWLLFSPPSFALSFSSLPISSFFSSRKIESSYCYLGSSHTLWVWSSPPLIQPRFIESPWSK